MIDRQIIKKIKHALVEQERTAASLAMNDLGIPPSTLYNWLNGYNAMPDEIEKKISSILGLDVYNHLPKETKCEE